MLHSPTQWTPALNLDTAEMWIRHVMGNLGLLLRHIWALDILYSKGWFAFRPRMREWRGMLREQVGLKGLEGGAQEMHLC